MESRYPSGVQPECVEECKVHNSCKKSSAKPERVQ